MKRCLVTAASVLAVTLLRGCRCDAAPLVEAAPRSSAQAIKCGYLKCLIGDPAGGGELNRRQGLWPSQASLAPVGEPPTTSLGSILARRAMRPLATCPSGPCPGAGKRSPFCLTTRAQLSEGYDGCVLSVEPDFDLRSDRVKIGSADRDTQQVNAGCKFDFSSEVRLRGRGSSAHCDQENMRRRSRGQNRARS
jgi:hypothetical protein